MLDFSQREAINKQAEHVRELCNLDINFDIKDFVKDLGGQIVEDDSIESEFEDFDAEIIPSASLTENTYMFQIRLGTYKPEKRQRFSIAHELGHLFLHMFDIQDNKIVINDRRYNREKTSSQLEWEANEFAAALLMPRKEFIECSYENLNEDTFNIGEIAKCFNVSEQACEVRGRILGLW